MVHREQKVRRLLGSASMSATRNSLAPRDGLVRLYAPGIELRSATAQREGEPDVPVMNGHFCIFNRWTEIDSWFEGNFMERLAKGSAKKTMKDQRENIKVLFQHGRDNMIGSKPLGPISELREDEEGGYYEVPLLDAPYVREELLPGLKEKLYGASFRFAVMREEWVEEPKVSEHNPRGIPERTIKEFRLSEFGPVTFPAYPDATAGLRDASGMYSATDAYIAHSLGIEDPEMLRMAGEGASLQDLIKHRLVGETDERPRRERIDVSSARTADEADEPAEPEAETPAADDAADGTETSTDADERSDDQPESETPGKLKAPVRDPNPPRPPAVEPPRHAGGNATPGRSSTSRLPLHTTQRESWRL